MKPLQKLLFSASINLVLLLPLQVYAQQAEDPVLATVNEHEITQSYVNTQIAKMPLGDQVSVRSNVEKFVESLIQEEVLFQSVFNDGFASEPELRDEVKALVANHLIEKYVSNRPAVTEQEVAAFYDENTSAIRNETVNASHILTNTRAECEALQAQVNAGGNFAELARNHSIHTDSAVNGGAIGSFMNHAGPLGFEVPMFQMQPGETQLFESEDGCHLVTITSRTTPPLPSLENVAPRILELLTRQREQDALRELIESANRKVTVSRNP
ncbi:hypothetical protein AB833_09260 [Chromatiales bacterium (ex Bugula neritina AB1)]|nr:hypothetical protein AB833_09260 [Chromatiales bacterium (ex Bugula neritina AB1)]